jgi:uncharacterized protein
MFKELVEYIVKSLVDHPEQVSVSEREGQSAVNLELRVADSDMGRVIGKGGRVINSIRALVQVLAAKRGKRVTLEIV